MLNGHDWLSSCRFFFTYGAFKAGFQKISGIGGRTEPEYLHEGGQSCSYPLPGAKGSTGTLTLEKGCGSYRHPFYTEGGFRSGFRVSSQCSIIILGEDNIPQRVFSFDNGIIVSWECSPLDAGTGDLLIDKVEIAHTGIYEMNIAPMHRLPNI